MGLSRRLVSRGRRTVVGLRCSVALSRLAGVVVVRIASFLICMYRAGLQSELGMSALL
jgi:hypothetical protein